MGKPVRASRRAPLNREVVLRTAVALADHAGIETVSMRSLAQELGVVPMALYKHVTNKEELLDGMVDVIVAEIDPPTQGARWKDTIRQRILSARQVQLRHRWAPCVGGSISATMTSTMPSRSSSLFVTCLYSAMGTTPSSWARLRMLTTSIPAWSASATADRSTTSRLRGARRDARAGLPIWTAFLPRPAAEGPS